MTALIPEEQLIKSQDRVRAHGEVFTPKFMVNQMLDLVTPELETGPEFVDKTFFEPAAGAGNFLVAILQRKLNALEKQYQQISWESESLFVLASIYGVELLEDNHHAAQQAMLRVFVEFHNRAGNHCEPGTDLYRAATMIITCNILHGDTITSLDNSGHELQFSWWHRVESEPSKVRREPFSLSSLRNSFNDVGMFDFTQYETYEICRIEHVYKGLKK